MWCLSCTQITSSLLEFSKAKFCLHCPSFCPSLTSSICSLNYEQHIIKMSCPFFSLDSIFIEYVQVSQSCNSVSQCPRWYIKERERWKKNCLPFSLLLESVVHHQQLWSSHSPLSQNWITFWNPKPLFLENVLFYFLFCEFISIQEHHEFLHELWNLWHAINRILIICYILSKKVVSIIWFQSNFLFLFS